MSKDQIKYEINKVLDLMPDKALEDLLSFLKNEGKTGELISGQFKIKQNLNRGQRTSTETRPVIPTKEILTIHTALIDNFGGSHGVRDMTSLESALARPFQTYDNADLYKTPLDKAAALIESLLINHPFVDGNKRTGYTALRLFLLQHGLDLTASQTSRYDFVIAVATGSLKYEAILLWLTDNTKPRSGA